MTSGLLKTTKYLAKIHQVPPTFAKLPLMLNLVRFTISNTTRQCGVFYITINKTHLSKTVVVRTRKISRKHFVQKLPTCISFDRFGP